MTVKRVIADAGVSVRAKWRANQISIQNSGIRTSLVNIRRSKTVRWRRILWCHRATRARSGELANAADTCIHWICYYGSSKMRSSPFNRDYYRIIVSYIYRINFDLSYRLSIENSIWHIVTALIDIHDVAATLPLKMSSDISLANLRISSFITFNTCMTRNYPC